ncbi:uncharacterized protein Z520_09173 [Fonsecaea multimorphosa CBS 102226]|uniref:Galactose oxidase-like Early set domain-containing protein n=1 Tax=Fonsecaea multimorphosa CBS 102226 TaxID=1442371 RepID=A0A0D2IDN8_9EURO|nr:uncharacterized protein Z520_09173 [Fonsecaea multimorphosa CBS 102226]KIX95256.1 hypothetical protein Z520_09173 [Fonsecaea multimorphosa CBS 102226]OAL17254.1 hypothetical protein AYO22_11819 [Fonsecaea multimorphosa]
MLPLSLPFLSFYVGTLSLVAPAVAQQVLPYNPTRVALAQDGSVAYILSPQPSSSQFSLSFLNTSNSINAASSPTQLFAALPFLSNTASEAFVTLPDNEGITVLAGDCKDSARDLGLWRYTFSSNSRNGTWTSLTVTTTDGTLSPQYLAAGFTFSPNASTQDASLYIFGGMCPNDGSSNATDWISDASYSNTMLTIAPDPAAAKSAPYQLSLTGSRAPPIAEAGLTITPLTPTSSNSSGAGLSQQQNFVLLGGHTENAFINMSQLAIYSLPQESWAFVEAVQAPTTVEPRSGHTAVLTEDGSKIVVLGGWVGDTDTPAQPQLVVLELGQGYGGQGDWAWSVPTPSSTPFASGKGIYGHGVAMLPGGVMMVSGGYPISSSTSKSRRSLLDDTLFLNTTSFEWTTTYSNPSSASSSPSSASAQSSASGLKASEKAGLGAGLGLGLAAVAVVVIVWLIYARRLRARRAVREKELRELALGAERYHSPVPSDEDQHRYPAMRSASWAATMERKIESSGNPYPWAPFSAPEHQDHRGQGLETGESNSARYAERTGVQMEIPSPTRGLRKSMNPRGPMMYHPFNQHPPTGPGAVFRIEEEDEGSQNGSFKRTKTPKATDDRNPAPSDPFKDPPVGMDSTHHDNAAAQRKKEVDSWVDDWQSVAETMSLSRSTSQAHSRTYSNLSQFRNPPTVGEVAGRGSPEKSDRTGSNLSEKSMVSTSSYSRSVAGTLSRNVSQRSASAGYGLFSGAAAAMRGLGYGRQGFTEQGSGTGLTRAPSNRSVSLNIDAMRPTSSRDGTDTFSSARSKWGAAAAGEDQALLNRNHQRQQDDERDYRTLPDSPSKEKYSRAGSLTSSSRRALNLLGSVRRVFTGTGGVDVQDRVATFESQSSQSSPTKHSGQPEMTETTPKRTLSVGTSSFWRSKQGAKDWEDDLAGPSNTVSSSTLRRKPVPGMILNDDHGPQEDDEDWDVETAVQKRVVQVMFTVPKEKLRVVNADALSLLSSNRSEIDQDEEKEREHIKRMSSVREGDEDSGHDLRLNDDTMKGKGKERAP